jgi:hypothetical protein
MKAIAVVLMLLGFVAGCARDQSASPSATPDRPEPHKSKADY